ncbi:MAG: hypothetical protein K0M45_11850 [Candidatus Paracaedibacteraceae bacterium]|nr:hypothetical protein [Candidatus Paracaedibacteraceae bacterium]
MNQEHYKVVMESLWVLAEKGLSHLRVDCISNRSGVAESAIEELFPHQHNILLAMIENLKLLVELPAVDPRLTPRDQIFDAVMLYFDVVQPHRLAIKRLVEEIMWHPLLLKNIMPELYSIGATIIDKYYPSTGMLQIGQNLAFNGAMAYALKEFIDDDTFDLSKTMAALDQGLKTVDDLTTRCQGLFNFK